MAKLLNVPIILCWRILAGAIMNDAVRLNGDSPIFAGRDRGIPRKHQFRAGAVRSVPLTAAPVTIGPIALYIVAIVLPVHTGNSATSAEYISECNGCHDWLAVDLLTIAPD
jgi:hypothetical protein